MPDAAHLVGRQTEIFPRVLLGNVGDTQSLVKVLKLGLVRREVPTFLVPCDVWCWARGGTKQETRFYLQTVLLQWSPGHLGVLKVCLGPEGTGPQTADLSPIQRGCAAQSIRVPYLRSHKALPHEQDAHPSPFLLSQKRDSQDGTEVTTICKVISLRAVCFSFCTRKRGKTEHAQTPSQPPAGRPEVG